METMVGREEKEMGENFDEAYLLQTGMENCHNYGRVHRAHPSISSFLNEHGYIGIRSSAASLEEIEHDLDMAADIDGVTIQWKNISGTTHIFQFLVLKLSLKKVYPLLKKHEDLVKYTNTSRAVLRQCVGTAIYTDGGWEYVLCLLPDYRNEINFSKDVTSEGTLRWLNQVKVEFRRRLIDSVPGGIIKRTLSKTNLNDVSKVFIQPGEYKSVLKMFQNCIDSVVPPQGFRKIMFSFRFGEKNRDRVHFPFTDSVCISKICVHVAVSIEPVEAEESLLWSRTGLEGLVGSRGTLTTACGLYECANFQSHLGELGLNVSGILRRVSVHPDKVQFIQLYADVAHYYPKTRYHPVSAAIIIPDGLRSATAALEREAKEYIGVIESNFIQLSQCICRLEFVTSLPEKQNSVIGEDLARFEVLNEMLAEHAMLVPFGNRMFVGSLREVGLNLCESLKMLLKTYKGTSCSESVWQSYQYELALEKLIWGHPLCYQSRQYAINLGPGIEYPSRCASDQFGFVKLEDKYSCCIDEHTAPPLTIYSGSKYVREQIQKTFGFWDLMESNVRVIGRRLLEILIRDLYDVGSVFALFGTFVASLKKEGNHSMRVVGVISETQLVQSLSNVTRCKFPMVYLHLLKMLRKRGKDVETTLRNGIEEIELVYFPAFRNMDQNRHAGLYWHFSYGVWAIRHLDKNNSSEIQGSMLCALVLNELERRQLCYTRSLQGTNDTFPWVRVCLRKLDHLRLKEQELVKVMTFVTCVAFVEFGRFIRYDKLRHLLEELPVPQYQLRDMEIQGKFLVNNMNAFKLWRLHPTIPRQAPKLSNEQQTSGKPSIEMKSSLESEEKSEALDVTSRIDTEHYEENVENSGIKVRPRVRHLPTNHKARWSCEELAILSELHETLAIQATIGTVYKKYQEECELRGIPDRSLDSFRARYNRL